MTLLFAVAVCLCATPMASSQEFPFRNTSLPFDERVKVGFIRARCSNAECQGLFCMYIGPGRETNTG